MAWKVAWEVIGEDIFNLIRACADIGHHPMPFCTSITVALRKPGKPDYSKTKAYRPIQLLEVLGKVLERIEARRLSYLCLKHNLRSPNHFGGVQGKSAEDAALTAVHDIEAAHNQDYVTTSLTFDISITYHTPSFLPPSGS